MKLSLPARNTDVGAVSRLLLAEARSPGSRFYDPTATLTGMQWMKRVLYNRLNYNPGLFLAPHAKTLTDIIKAPRQFEGFANYPHYDPEVMNWLQSILDIANHPKDRRSATYSTFVKDAIDVALAGPVPDPAVAAIRGSLGLFGWRTVGSGDPGGSYVKYQDLAGNTFYTLSL